MAGGGRTQQNQSSRCLSIMSERCLLAAVHHLYEGVALASRIFNQSLVAIANTGV